MGRERKGEFAGLKAHENNLHGASGAHSKGAGGAPRVRITSILKALTGAAAIQAFSLSLGPDLKMRRIGLNQVETRVDRVDSDAMCEDVCVLARDLSESGRARERPVDLSPRFKEATR